MTKNAAYEFAVDETVLAFRTTSFRTEKGSVLHSGIYNREMASTLAAGACVTLLGFFFASAAPVSAVHYIAALAVFVLLFLFFRTFVFFDTILQAVMDKRNKVLTIMQRGTLHAKKLLFPLSDIVGVREDYKEVAPENPDGVKVVEKIALRHGTVIPGFGETEALFTVALELKSAGSIVVFSSKDHAEADTVAKTFNNFIERE